MEVTIGIIAYNEEKYINALFNSILDQNYDLKKIEVVIVDAVSTDNTLQIMKEFREKNLNSFLDIKIFSNKNKTQSYGWNIVIDNVKTDVLVKIDAHSILCKDYVKETVNLIKQGETICGGRIIKIIDDKNKFKDVLLIAENSMFGSSFAKYRRSEKPEYVSTLLNGTYKKKIFDEVGNYDTNILRAEDNEIHYRMRNAGYKFCYSPKIYSYYHSRSDLKSMMKQKYGNGKWVGLTAKSYTPKIFSIFYFIPLLFTLAIICSVAMSIASIFVPNNIVKWILNVPSIGLFSSYSLFVWISTFIETIRNKNILGLICLPVLYFMMHIFYGLGTISGLLKKRIKL